MSSNPFEVAGAYPKMLAKIALSTFFAAILAVVLLRREFPVLDKLLEPLSISVPIATGFSLPFGTVLPAFLFGGLSRIFKLHDRISDVFQIRRRFDVSDILFPLAIGSGSSLTANQMRAIKKNRDSLMYEVFYRYASGTPGKAAIDSLYIKMALDQWCWYWIVLESTFLAFCLGVTFFIAKRYFLAASFLAGVIMAILVLQLIRNLCSDYALQEVEAILDSPGRSAAIAGVFSAL
jgi:hypothetical protein